MRSFLPGQGLDDFEAARVARLRCVEIRTNGGLVCADERENIRQHAGHARPGAIRRGGWLILIAPIVVLEAEVVHDSRRKYGGESNDALVRPVGVMRPVGRIAKFERLREAVVSIVGVAQEQVVFRRDVIVQAEAQLFADVRAPISALERGERRGGVLHRDRLHLIHVFVVEEEEKLVLFDGAAQPCAWIAASEERTRIEGVTRESWIGRHIVIAVKEVGASVQSIASRAGDDIDGASGTDAGSQIEIRGGDLEFLDGVHREVH